MSLRTVVATLWLVGLILPACAEAQLQDSWGGLSYGATLPESDSETWRQVDPAHLLVFETNKGRILIEAFPEVAPRHYEQFAAIIRSGDFDGTHFHRVIDGFMAQGGDIFALKGRESGLPDIPGEFTFRRDVSSLPPRSRHWPPRIARSMAISGASRY